MRWGEGEARVGTSARPIMKSSDIPAAATGVITIDLRQLVANWRALSELVAPAECGAVVKADAYGLGAGRVIPALWSAGCRTFFIATPDEAETARRLVPAATIYALDGLIAGATADLISSAAIPVLGSIDEICAWVQAASAHPSRLQRRAPHRHGAQPARARRIRDRYAGPRQHARSGPRCLARHEPPRVRRRSARGARTRSSATPSSGCASACRRRARASPPRTA